jgi:hypothetical protein
MYALSHTDDYTGQAAEHSAESSSNGCSSGSGLVYLIYKWYFVNLYRNLLQIIVVLLMI